MFSPFVHRLQARCVDAGASAAYRQTAAVPPAMLVRMLPALGDVLYVPMPSDDVSREPMPPGVLVECAELAPLLQARYLVQATVITVDGPREWIECVDRRGHICCRLHLLPDTDYLGWDRLIAAGTPAEVTPARLSFPRARAVCAQLLRFHHRSLAGLLVLGADTAGHLSPMGRYLADRIARDEAVALQ
jgi:hypothetical protein